MYGGDGRRGRQNHPRLPLTPQSPTRTYRLIHRKCMHEEVDIFRVSYPVANMGVISC